MRPSKDTAREHDAFVSETADFVFTIKLMSERSVQAAASGVTQSVLSALAIALAEGVSEQCRDMGAWKEPAVSAERDPDLDANTLRVRVETGPARQLVDAIAKAKKQRRAAIVSSLLDSGLEVLEKSSRNAAAEDPAHTWNTGPAPLIA